jgi:UDP-glucose 4-epimerase
MKVLITGASGFIGRNLVEHLSERYDLLTPRRDELDLVDELSVDTYLRNHAVDVVIHTAGKPGHRNAKDPNAVFYDDTRMYFSLMRNRDCFGKLIIAGSGAVYDMRKYRPKMKEEEWKANIPADEHGFFRYVTAHHIEASSGVVDLRLFGVFGKYEDYAIRFISNAICKVLFDLPITIRQNRKFDYLYINDLFPVVDHFIGHDAKYNEYNVTPDNPISLREMAERVLAVSGKDLPIGIAREEMGMEYSGDNSRLKQELPNLTFTAIDDSITQLYEWYQVNKSQINRASLLIDK